MRSAGADVGDDLAVLLDAAGNVGGLQLLEGGHRRGIVGGRVEGRLLLLGRGDAADAGGVAGAARVPRHQVEAVGEGLGQGAVGACEVTEEADAGLTRAARVEEQGADAARGIAGRAPDQREGDGARTRVEPVERDGVRAALEAPAAVVPRHGRGARAAAVGGGGGAGGRGGRAGGGGGGGGGGRLLHRHAARREAGRQRGGEDGAARRADGRDDSFMRREGTRPRPRPHVTPSARTTGSGCVWRGHGPAKRTQNRKGWRVGTVSGGRSARRRA